MNNSPWVHFHTRKERRQRFVPPVKLVTAAHWRIDVTPSSRHSRTRGWSAAPVLLMNSSLDTDCTGIGDGNNDSADESFRVLPATTCSWIAPLNGASSAAPCDPSGSADCCRGYGLGTKYGGAGAKRGSSSNLCALARGGCMCATGRKGTYP